MADFIGYHGAGDDHRQFKLITDRNRLGIRPAEHVRILNFFNIFIMMKIINDTSDNTSDKMALLFKIKSYRKIAV